MSDQEPELQVQGISIVIPVYRDAARAVELVHALKRQQVPADLRMEIILVEDGSGDGSAEQIERAMAGIDGVLVLALPANQGRAAARNTGAARSGGTLIAFVDCDCLPATASWLAAHLVGMDKQMVATTGPVTGDGEGFWSRYQTEASARRRSLYSTGARYAGSSQNMVVRRDAFLACGGFDTAFQTYGFEDRDLLVRLGTQGDIGWLESTAVRHMDSLSMRSVSKKMVEAGGNGAVLFSARHPEAYRELGYARLDTRLNPWLLPIARLARPMLPHLAGATDPLVTSRWWPYPIKRALVRWLTALSYLCGTAKVRPGQSN